MTREEALLKPQYDSNEKVREVIKVTNIHINKIYDALESRTCENCKHYITAIYGGYKNMCSYGVDIRMTPTSSFGGTSPDFGCNKFERKDK